MHCIHWPSTNTFPKNDKVKIGAIFGFYAFASMLPTELFQRTETWPSGEKKNETKMDTCKRIKQFENICVSRFKKIWEQTSDTFSKDKTIVIVKRTLRSPNGRN